MKWNDETHDKGRRRNAAIADLAWLSYVSFPRFPRSRPEGTINIITSQTESQTPAAGVVPVTGPVMTYNYFPAPRAQNRRSISYDVVNFARAVGVN